MTPIVKRMWRIRAQGRAITRRYGFPVPTALIVEYQALQQFAPDMPQIGHTA